MHVHVCTYTSPWPENSLVWFPPTKKKEIKMNSLNLKQNDPLTMRNRATGVQSLLASYEFWPHLLILPQSKKRGWA